MLRAQPHRYNQDGVASRWCMPIVLEMQVARLVRMGGGSTMHCCPGVPGQRHGGVRLLRMHVNIEYMMQYMLLEMASIRSMLLLPTVAKCSCKTCGAVSGLSGNPEWETWTKSRNNLWYRKRCYDRVVAMGQVQVLL